MSTYFGVDSFFRADTKLQPNLTLYEWVVRNQSMPKFWGRTLDGKEALTCEEISFLHEKGTKIAMIYNGAEKDSMSTEENGIDDAKNIHYMLQSIAPSLPENKAVFLLIAEDYNPRLLLMSGNPFLPPVCHEATSLFGNMTDTRIPYTILRMG